MVLNFLNINSACTWPVQL